MLATSIFTTGQLPSVSNDLRSALVVITAGNCRLFFYVRHVDDIDGFCEPLVHGVSGYPMRRQPKFRIQLSNIAGPTALRGIQDANNMTTQITVSQLQRLTGTPSSPVIVDVCLDEDFGEFPYLIPTAIRCSHDSVLDLVPDLNGSHVVVVCQKGLKLSEGAAGLLRSAGVRAEHLKGGMLAWKDARAIKARSDAIPSTTRGEPTVWVTRSRPKIDRIACPWLIRRFIDRHARFLFVSGSQVKDVAERFGATAFDVDNVVLGHHGERCTFDAMLDHFELSSAPLERLARVIRAADTNQHDQDVVAAGLHAISVGLSRMYRDDLEQLEAGIGVYDALYRWARDAADEEHDSSCYKAPGSKQS